MTLAQARDSKEAVLLLFIKGFEVKTAQFLLDAGLVSSHAAARRLVKGGAVDRNGQAQDSVMEIWSGDTLRVGKHNFQRIVFGEGEEGALSLYCTNATAIDEWPRFRRAY